MKTRKHVIARSVALVAAAGGLLFAALGFSTGAGTSEITLSGVRSQPYVPDELLVKFKPGVSAASQAQSIASVGAATIATLSQPGLMHIKLPAALDVPHALAAYAGDPNVESAQPNYIYHLAAVPNDANYGAQWALNNTAQTITTAPQPGTGSTYLANNPGTAGDDLDIQLAWDHITDCSTVTVAVVDTGVNYNNAELAGNMWNGGLLIPNHGWNFINNTNDPMDLHGHGTHVAGIIGAIGNNGTGTSGVCWKASIMAVRVVDAAGVGTTATITLGVDFAVANGAKIINMSLAVPILDPLLSNSISNAQNKGVILVTAAGNDGLNNDVAATTTKTYPCDFTQANIICVAALDQKYQLASFSNYGPISVDVGAPGTNVLNTWAGASAQITDPLTTGWTFTTTTVAGGWASRNIATTLGPLQMLVDPLTWPLGLYNNNTDDRIYKAFNLAGASSAAMFADTNINIANGDHFQVAYNAAGGDPFVPLRPFPFDLTGIADGTTFFLDALDLSACLSTTCSVGARLLTDPSVQGQGVALTLFSIETLALNTTGQNTLSGTSMATPHAAGVAAMVMAYNPADTYLEVINAVEKGGRATAALAGKTTSGMAVDALGALAYINPPAGLTASVQ